MKTLKVGVKFCGNCNPRINGGTLLNEISGEVPEGFWLPADSLDKDVLLIISGCAADCATRPIWAGPTIIVAGEAVDYEPCNYAELVGVVSKKLEVIKDELAGNI